MATIAAGAIAKAGELLGLAGSKPIAEVAIALVLFKFYPERNCAPWSFGRIVTLLSLGVALSVFWVIAFAWGRTIFPDLAAISPAAIFIGVLSSVVTAPIFEEKVVRHLLLAGVSGFLNRWVSAALVSVIFALAHQGSMAWSFLVSIVLCWLALAKAASSLQRAITHSTVNAMILLWYFSNGFGLAG
ncbi:CPBP family glutamic-type intramembrane protease [Pseudoxanthomonas sp. 10H]|uniref:CPBP family glutamic-type intramembrane protease n=1 Tax=Pseudoxanthomonas sp. 10H TaxID=3242729 RepID=UPI003556A685